MNKAYLSEGPNVSLNRAEMKILREKKYIDFDFSNINGVLRITVTNQEVQGKMSEQGIHVRRYPQGISPYEYEGKQLWVIRLSKKKLDELVTESNEDRYRYGCIDSRCLYDRMSVGYYSR